MLPPSSSRATSSWSTRRRRSPPRSTPWAPTARRWWSTCRPSSTPAAGWSSRCGGRVAPTGRPHARADGSARPLRHRSLWRRAQRSTCWRRTATPGRLWVASLTLPQRRCAWLAGHGRPIRYGYVDRPWPLGAYQNVYATEPGSAEMPSAGRPFTPEVITRLVAKGVGVTPVVLHTGVASLEADELPYPERCRVPAATADRVNADPRRGRPGDRRRHDRGPGARDGDRRRRHRAALRRLDRPRDHPRARRARRRRPADRLARTGGLAPADAGGGRRPATLLEPLLRRPASPRATSGTSSATST